MTTQTNCPGCSTVMNTERYERVLGGELSVDICYACCAIWFDHTESLQLAPASIIAMFRQIHEHRAEGRRPLPVRLPCPRCRHPLKLTNDIVKTGAISYYRCEQSHGRLSTFLHFLREKKFVRDLTAGEIATVRAQLAEVRCSGCGAPVDIKTHTVCGYCRAPLSVLDADAVENALKEYAVMDRRRHDPARIAAALMEALVLQPAHARANERAQTLDQKFDLTWSTGDLMLGGISALMRSLAD